MEKRNEMKNEIVLTNFLFKYIRLLSILEQWLGHRFHYWTRSRHHVANLQSVIEIMCERG